MTVVPLHVHSYKYPMNPPSSTPHCPSQIAQVIRNLVSNALKFSPRDGVATLHAVFVPSSEAVITLEENQIFSSLRQMMHDFSARVRRSGSVFAVAPPASNVVALPPTDKFTAGFLRITVIDHG